MSKKLLGHLEARCPQHASSLLSAVRLWALYITPPGFKGDCKVFFFLSLFIFLIERPLMHPKEGLSQCTLCPAKWGVQM